MLPDGEVLVHTPAAGILVDKVDAAVVSKHNLIPGVRLGGRAGSDPLVDTPGNVPRSGVLPAHAGQPTEVCVGVPGSLAQLEMMAEYLSGMGMVTGVWSGKDLGTSSLYIMTLAWSEVLVVSLTS